MGTSRKLGLAVVGLGRMGMVHAKNLMQSSRAQVKWLVELNTGHARELAANMGSPAQCAPPEDLKHALLDDSVDGVVVCTPTSHHESQVKAALEAGKHVCCEKPITADITSTRQCYELAELKNRTLICAFHRRFDDSFLHVRNHVQNQTSGPLRLLRISSHDMNPPPISYIKMSGGILKDSTIHDLDMALWVSGPAKSVFVAGQAFDPEIGQCGDHDLVVVTIRHQNGALTVIDNGRRCAHGYDQRLEAMCENGSYVVTNRGTNLVTTHTTEHTAVPGIDQGFNTRYPSAYANEMEHFLDILEGKTTPRITKEDTLAVLTLAEKAKESAKLGTPVDL